MKIITETEEEKQKIDMITKSDILDLEEQPIEDINEKLYFDLQLNLIEKLLPGINFDDMKELIQPLYTELYNKLAILNRFEILNSDNSLYFLRNNLFNEKELYAVLTELENYALPTELYQSYVMSFSKGHINFVTDKYNYSPKEKLVNLNNFRKLLKDDKTLTYK